MGRRRQRGAVLALVLAIVVMLMVAAAATYALSRLTSAREDTGDVAKRLEAAAAALEQFAGTAQRLPCPANPAIDDGVEVQATVSTCSFPEGTIPWRTIGMRRDDSYDPWGRKISYRVYTGNSGSFTQPGGISMVECDTVEPSAGNLTPLAGSTGGLCVSNANPQLRNSSAARFLAGKGLVVSDNGTARSAAFVLISHGATGLGGYTVSGVRLDLPAGDERDNTRDTGPFTARAFSDVETKATAGTHFDDFVVYRSVEDLVKKVGLAARDWPEADPTSVASITFDAPTIAGATGTTPTTTSTLANSIDFGNAVVTGFGSGAAPGLAYGSTGVSGTETATGLGVGGGVFTGFYAFLNNMLTNYDSESLRIDTAQKARMFAITFDDADLTTFGIFFKVELRFFNVTKSGGTETATPVATVTKERCVNGRHTASFSVPVAADFNRVEIVPVDSDYYAALSAFLVGDIKACSSAATTCRTATALAASPANATDCP